jgi:hypothetical protein
LKLKGPGRNESGDDAYVRVRDDPARVWTADFAALWCEKRSGASVWTSAVLGAMSGIIERF